VAAAVTAAAAAATAGDEDGGAACITFIDYEYSGFNPVAYDIANHWCEWAADYHTETPHILDFNRLPDKQQQLLFVEAYLRALLAKLGVQVPQPPPGFGIAAAAAGGSNGGAGVTTAAPPASPEAASLSSLAGFALASRQQNPDSSHRSEPAWSTLSSRGPESVISFPETDAGWETASQSSVVTTKSQKAEAEDGGIAGVGSSGVSAAAVAGVLGGAAADGVRVGMASSIGDLCDVWCWLDRAIGLGGCGSNGSSSSSRQLSVAAWQQLVQQVVSAADAYMAASHLLWALWGVIQAKVSDVDFDFTGYGQQRWRMYLQTRPAAAPAAAAVQHKQQ
jgi:hypothetical protein